MIMTKKTANLPNYVAVILADRDGKVTLDLAGFEKTKLSALVKFEEFKRLCAKFNAKDDGSIYAPFVLRTKELVEDMVCEYEKNWNTYGICSFHFLVGIVECAYGDYSCSKKHNAIKYEKTAPGRKDPALPILQKKWPRYNNPWKH